MHMGPYPPGNNIAPENIWLEDDPCLFGAWPIFQERAVSLREGKNYVYIYIYIFIATWLKMTKVLLVHFGPFEL